MPARDGGISQRSSAPQAISPPTYVYSGSLDILAPDEFLLQQAAVTQHAPISFVLANGQIHDWVILTLDGLRYWPEINQQLGIAA